MARKIHQHGDGEHDDSEHAQPAQADAKLEGGALGVPDAKNTVGGAEVAPSNAVFEPSGAKKYQVAATSRINGAGGITHLHAGQIIDDNNYDIGGLRRAGVKLTEYVEPTPEVSE
jgi:hypothetical protein